MGITNYLLSGMILQATPNPQTLRPKFSACKKTRPTSGVPQSLAAKSNSKWRELRVAGNGLNVKTPQDPIVLVPCQVDWLQLIWDLSFFCLVSSSPYNPRNGFDHVLDPLQVCVGCWFCCVFSPKKDHLGPTGWKYHLNKPKRPMDFTRDLLHQ